MTLRACYEVKLDAPLFLANAITAMNEVFNGASLDSLDIFRGKSTELQVPVINGEGTVDIVFHFDNVPNPVLRAHNTWAVDQLTVTISKELVGRNIDDREVFAALKTEYFQSLRDTLTPLLDYFRYERGMPFLRPINAGHVTSCTWKDANGNVIRDDEQVVYLAEFPGFPAGLSSLGSSALPPTEMYKLHDAIVSPKTYTVVDELRSQARDAIFEGQLMLAVLLLAVATEVAVKLAFFGEGSIASDAFDFLEDKGKVEVSTIEMIHGVAKRAFGVSFQEAHPKDYEHISFLFRCRNKVAHRGRLLYSDGKNGPMRTLDRGTMNQWWNSVTNLLEWLSDQKSKLSRASP